MSVSLGQERSRRPYLRSEQVNSRDSEAVSRKLFVGTDRSGDVECGVTKVQSLFHPSASHIDTGQVHSDIYSGPGYSLGLRHHVRVAKIIDADVQSIACVGSKVGNSIYASQSERIVCETKSIEEGHCFQCYDQALSKSAFKALKIG